MPLSYARAPRPPSYKDFTENRGNTFAPFVMEPYGGFGEKALDLVKTSARKGVY